MKIYYGVSPRKAQMDSIQVVQKQERTVLVSYHSLGETNKIRQDKMDRLILKPLTGGDNCG